MKLRCSADMVSDLISKKSFESPLPRFWRNAIPVIVAARLYCGIAAIRSWLFDTFPFLSHCADRPVISIGAIRAGGTGKTPVAKLTAQIVQSLGWSVAFLSRGYRRVGRGMKIALPDEEIPWDSIGDEPSMLRRAVRGSFVAAYPNRVRSAAVLSGLVPEKTVFLLDDGFQHRRLRRDLDIVCLHEAAMSDRPLPQGFLREGFRSLRRANVVLLIGSPQNGEALERTKKAICTRFPQITIFFLYQEPANWIELSSGRESPVTALMDPYALCGIARPERFLEMANAGRKNPLTAIVFPDHHKYEISDLVSYRDIYSRGIVTTEKDAIRLQNLKVAKSIEIWYLKIRLVFSRPDHEHQFKRIIQAICPT